MIKIVPVFITWRKVLQICPVFFFAILVKYDFFCNCKTQNSIGF